MMLWQTYYTNENMSSFLMNAAMRASVSRRLKKPEVHVSQEDWVKADKEFRPNCGPAALAVMTKSPLIDACKAIPGFKERHYTNPTMMAAALRQLGVPFHERDDAECDGHTLTEYGIVRIQWEGPWTAQGSNPRWAYRHTHWIGAAKFFWPTERGVDFVFDVNCGWQMQADWETIHVPKIIEEVADKRATGNWWATHRWELEL